MTDPMQSHPDAGTTSGATAVAPPIAPPATPTLQTPPLPDTLPDSLPGVPGAEPPSEIPPAPDLPAPGPPVAPQVTPATRDVPARPRADGAAVAELVNAGRLFGDVVALEDVSLAVTPGTLVGVIGPSGAGKTTAIRLLTGGLRPTSGTARVMGEDPVRLSASNRERIGFMPQSVSLYDELTVAENLDFMASVFGLFLPQRRRRIRAVLEWLELEPARSRRASALSGGMRRRLQLACALVHDPDLVFLDEPTSGIDPIVRQAIWTELHRLRDLGRALIVTTQVVSEAENCDMVALISDGRLVALAPPDDLRRQALGGDLLEVEAADPIDPVVLRQLDGVTRVEQLDPRRVRILSPDAASATPVVVDAVRATGNTVAAVETPRPSFDEIFVMLVEHARREGAAKAAAAEADR
jgi:ABC-2 type transport system ATP-binding protein